MSEPRGAHSLLPPLVLRNLGDKSYEKRKQAALEIEHIVKDLKDSTHSKASTNNDVIRAIITTITKDFAYSTQSNQRKGGLIGLAATSIALMDDAHLYLDILLPPVLKCFNDPESRVRYYACEALYNISKVARGSILLFFNEIFDGLCKLYSDPDVDVKNGSALLDRLIKDLVVESQEFDLEKFIPLLRERIRIKNPFIRQLLVGWITVLDSVPDIDMIEWLPEYLGGLFEMLGDINKDIRQQAYAALTELLRELINQYNNNASTLDLSSMILILVHQCNETKDNFTCLTLLTWIYEFILIDRQGKLLFYTPDILGIVLTCISDPEKEIRSKSEKTNEALLKLVQSHSVAIANINNFNIGALLGKVSVELSNKWVLSRMAALRWINTLMAMFPNQFQPHINTLFTALLKTLHDQDDTIIRIVLEILARISLTENDNGQSFEMVLSAIMKLFAHDRRFLETRGSLVIRQLCELLDAEQIYRAFAKLLTQSSDSGSTATTTTTTTTTTAVSVNGSSSEDGNVSTSNISNQYELSSLMVQTLNLILLTSTELFDLRQRLKSALTSAGGRELFQTLFASWCHNPISTLSLCLLAESYELSAALIPLIAHYELTVGALMQIDTLVQLIESPIFLQLRLNLLQPMKCPSLIQSLYGLLMLMPQSQAFTALNTRLQSIAPLHIVSANTSIITANKLLTSDSGNDSKGEKALDTAALLTHFTTIQSSHAKKRQSLFKSQSLIHRNDAKLIATGIGATSESNAASSSESK